MAAIELFAVIVIVLACVHWRVRRPFDLTDSGRVDSHRRARPYEPEDF